MIYFCEHQLSGTWEVEVGAGEIDGIQQWDSVGIDVDIAESKGNITLSKSKMTILVFLKCGIFQPHLSASVCLQM